jgi:predicted metal-binding membrane protein
MTSTASGRSSERAFYTVATLLFIASAAVTIVWCASMSSMHVMPMPGGWTMTMAWMRMPEQTWIGAAARFFGMWIVMMVAMMLPSLVPVLRQYRDAMRAAGEARLGTLTMLVAFGYFFVWTLVGVAAYPLGVLVNHAAMQQPLVSRLVPIAAGVAVVIAGALQFTPWKARHLSCCRVSPGAAVALSRGVSNARRHGMRLGVHCTSCCAGMMLILLVLGVMNLGVMAVVAAAITIERLAPEGERVARAVGVATIAAGLFLSIQAARLG